MAVDALILAAGLSSGTYPENKLMLRIDGKTLIEMTVDSLQDVCDTIVVVTGSKEYDFRNLLSSSAKVRVVDNPDYEKGMYSSVKAGLKSAKGDRIFIIPGDCPIADPSTPKLMLSFDAGIVIPTYNGQKGHPVLINRSEAERISLDTVHNSLREYLSNRQISEIPLEDPGILWDIDTITEYEQIKGFLTSGYIAIRTINPALSIMLEGLKVAYVLSICEKRKEHLDFSKDYLPELRGEVSGLFT